MLSRVIAKNVGDVFFETHCSGNLWCDITDHLPNFMIITGNSSTKCVRLFSSNNIQKFCYFVHLTGMMCIQMITLMSVIDLLKMQLLDVLKIVFPMLRLSRK